MATLSGFIATQIPKVLPLARGSYLVQNTSSTAVVLYANSKETPAPDVEWRVCERYQFFLIEDHDPINNPVWVKTRGPDKAASLSVGDYK